MKDKNYMLYIEGEYMMSALAATVGNMFRKKGTQPIEYFKEPIDIFAEKTLNIREGMTDEEKKVETDKVFSMLFDMQNKFETHKIIQGDKE